MIFETLKTFLFGLKPRQDPKEGSESHSAIELDEQPSHNTGITKDKYTYDPLPESGYIRLFELFPRSLSGKVFVRLFVVSINDLPRYDAISYVWGDATDTRTIICNRRPLRITRNLHDALKRFRASSKSTSQILWADAICINQDDLQERGRQVHLMRSIYAEACRVLVWLGPYDLKRALKAFPWLYSLDESGREQPMRPLYAFRVKERAWQEATKEVLSRPWFERVWALQEIGFAKDATFYYGGHKIAWESLCHLCHFFPPEFYKSWNVDVRKVLMIEDSFQFKRDRGSLNLNFFQLLNGARSYLATDPRDKVYALLGHPLFEQDDGSESIPIDYSQTKDELYLTVAKRLLGDPSLSGLSELLSCVEHTEDTLSSSPSLPSWVPRWDVKRATNSFDPVLHSAPGRTGAPLEHRAPVVQSTGVLVVDGSEVDSIAWQSEVFCTSSSIGPPETEVMFWEMRKILDVIKETQLASALANSLSVQQGDVLKNLAATLGALPTLQNLSTRSRLYIDHPRHGYGTRNVASLLSDLPDSRTLDRYLSHRFGYSRHQGLTARFPLLRGGKGWGLIGPSSYSLAVDRACGNRRFFITTKGHFGLGPSVAREGDSVVVLAGVRLPQVLRRVHQDYLLCGECYVNEIMYGPAFDLAVKLETFSIR